MASSDDDEWHKFSQTVKPLIPKDRALPYSLPSKNRFQSKFFRKIEFSPLPTPSFDIFTADSSCKIVIEKFSKSFKRSSINATLDLHGEIIKNAQPILSRFIEKAVHFDHRIILVITGKSLTKASSNDPRLVKMVPLWLKSPPLNQYVKKVTYAKREHGGDGAFYVFLKSFAVSY